MAETAVGLFEDAGVAEAVVDSLRAHGFPSNGIRVVAAPNGNGAIDSSDFAAIFSRDQRGIGVPESASGAYLGALGRGHVLVYATGSTQQTDEAVTIMDEYGAIEIDEMHATEIGAAGNGGASNGAVTGNGPLGTMNPEGKLPESQVTIGEHEHSYTSHASRAKKEGARIFSW